MAASTAAPYPVILSVADDQAVSNWRPLVHWALVIPHLLIVSILVVIANILAVITWFIVVIAGRLPPPIAEFQIMLFRYNYRAYGYLWGLSEQYPPFTFDDRGNQDDIRVDIVPALENRDRLSAFFRLVLLLPLAITGFVYVLGMYFIGVIAWFAVLFTGVYPLGLRMMMVGLFQYLLRFQAYAALLTDRYPPFGATIDTL